MIILDTNVISELMLLHPNRRVADWLDRQPRSQIWTSAVTVFELYRGVEDLPEGRRRRTLESQISLLLGGLFRGRILPFEADAAEHAGRIWAARRAIGRPIHVEDCQIASIALAHAAPVATRDVADFAGCGLELVNPWDD